MKKENSMITWNDSDASSKAIAFQQFSEAGDSYAGVTKAIQNTTTAKAERVLYILF